jgi:hypothetical protein
MHAPIGLPFLPAGSRPKGKIRLPQQDLAKKVAAMAIQP